MPPQTKHLTGPHNLPRQLTPFVGRKAELAKIATLLADPACCLLTLVGPGGIGKTRLAIEVAAGKLNDFPHGVFFVNLQPIHSAELLISAIADALNFSLSGQEEPQVQLFNYLSNKQMLLVLDNFEHLLIFSPPFPEERPFPKERSLSEKKPSPQEETKSGSGLLIDLLWAASNVKLLMTSREALNLQEEWLYPVGGLPFPNEGEGKGKAVVYDAVQLFINCTRRTRPDFSLADEEDGVVRICQLVEGMPLALELAASWTKTMRCQVIAAEIQRNIDFLATTFRNVPNRQRSMRAIFNQSWRLLTQEERNIFKRLSVFRDGFKRAAAERVAGASLPTLSTLVDKSLLRWDPAGRYYIHELLRQYAAEQLAQQPQDVTGVYDLHSDYYADFLQQQEQDLFSPIQQQVIQDIALEWENIRAAWQWAVNQINVSNMQRATFVYYTFCDFQGRFRECADVFEKAITGLTRVESNREIQLALTLLHVLQGWNYIRLGRFDNAQIAFKQSQTLYQNLGIEPPPGFGTDPVPGLALLAHTIGNYAEALNLGEEARRKHEARNDKLNLQITFYALGNAALAQGAYETAEDYLQQAHVLTQQTNNTWMRAYVLSELGNVAVGLGHLEQAQQHYQASFQLKETLNDPEGMARALIQQGNIAWRQQAHPEAEQLYRRSIAIYKNINDKGGLARALNGLGKAVLAQGDRYAACEYFSEALQIANEIQLTPLILALLADIGDVLLKGDRIELGLELLAMISQHPAGEYETKAQVQQTLDHYQSVLSPEIVSTTIQRGQNANLNSMIAIIQTELTALKNVVPPERPAPIETAPSAPQPPSASALVEPLTPRELEVLQLMAQGMTNQQIADELIISVGTAKWYTSEIYGKLGVSNRTQAVVRAREFDLLA